MKNLAIPFVLFLAALATQCGPPSRSTSTPSESSKQESAENRRVRVRQLMSVLASENEAATNAEKDLLELAQQDASARTIVLNEVISATDAKLTKPSADNHLTLWRSANRLFQRLHATEAIPLMIKFFWYGDGYGGNGTGHYPGRDSLIVLGVDAVPALSTELVNDPNVKTRIILADCLGNIGGPEARQALLLAKESEKSPEVLYAIELSLDAIARESKRP
jgi:hypothetical protein